MTSSYQFYIKHLDRFGVKKASSINDFTSFRYRKAFLGGRLDFTVNSSHRVSLNSENFDQFEVYWHNPSIGVPKGTRDFTGVFREPNFETDESSTTTNQLVCTSGDDILSYRHVAWFTGTVDRSQFTAVPAETVAKTLVSYNLTSLATVANGRMREGDLLPGMGMLITVAPDLGRGNLITRSFKQGQVLRIIKETLQPDAGGFFTLTKIGKAEWLFDFVENPGVDKSSGVDKVLFSLSRGNLLVPSLSIKRIGSATVAITMGRGRKDERKVITVNGPDYAVDNDLEMFVRAKNQLNVDALRTVALQHLEQKRELKVFDFNVVQTSNVFYSPVDVVGKKTYDVGTVVSVLYNDEEFPRRITAVTVTGGVDNPTYQFQIETEDIS